MGKLKVTIEKGPDLFGAWADNVPGIYGEGETVQETKENLLTSIELYKKHNSTVPKELQGEISVEWTLMYSRSSNIIAVFLPRLHWSV